MFVKRMCMVLAASLMGVSAFAQQSEGAKKTPNVHVLQQPEGTVIYRSGADVEALIARAKSESTDKTPMVVGDLLKLPPYTVLLEYRPAGKSFNAGTHPKDAELFYVLQGSGSLVTGGTLTADHMGIDGGQSQKVSKGDVLFVPEGTPHMFKDVEKTLVLMSIHIPRPVPGQ